MRALLTGGAVLSMLLALWMTNPAAALGQQAVPSAASIEKLLRDKLASDGLALPSHSPETNPYGNATLMDFKLVLVDRTARSRWHAEVDLLFDFGPPPPNVVGFERLRRGRYELVLTKLGERLGLSRFAPIARLEPLPAKGR